MEVSDKESRAWHDLAEKAFRLVCESSQKNLISGGGSAYAEYMLSEGDFTAAVDLLNKTMKAAKENPDLVRFDEEAMSAKMAAHAMAQYGQLEEARSTLGSMIAALKRLQGAEPDGTQKKTDAGIMIGILQEDLDIYNRGEKKPLNVRYESKKPLQERE